MTDLVQTIYQAALDIVGAGVDGRIHFATMPPDAVFPLVVYNPVFGGHGVRASGGKSVYNSRYQFDIYAATPAELLSLRHTMIVALQDYKTDFILSARIDTDNPYYVDELDVWRNIIDVTWETEWES
jgi:hypothetical protein